MRYVTTLIAFMVANFGYAWATTMDWSKATEHTYFQAAIVLCLFLNDPKLRGIS